MQFYFKKQIIFCLLFFMYALLANAQKADSLTPKELEEIRVYGNKKRFQLAALTPVQTLSGADLQRLNSFSVADAIRYFSGVQLKDYGGIGGLKTINVRNMGTQHVAVVLDGIRIVNAQNGTVDLGKYSLDNIEAIELYNGGNTEALQPAMNQFAASTIYLQTTRPSFNSAENYHYKATIKTGSFGLLNPSFLWQQKLSGTTFLTANTELVTANGKYKFYEKRGGWDTTATRKNADVSGIRSEVAFTKTLKEGELFIKTYYYGSNRGLPGAIVENKYYTPQRLNDKNFFLQGSYKNAFTPHYNIWINTKFSSDYTKYIDPDFIMTTGPLKNIYHQKEFYLSAAQQLKINNWWKLNLSADFSFNKMDANLYRFPYPTRYSYVSAFNSVFNWQRLAVTTGVLVAYFNDEVKQYQPAENKSAIMPTVSASWQILKNIPLRIRGFYKESIRMPSFNDLYYTEVGNTFLKPEYTKQWNLGFVWLPSTHNSSFNFSIQTDTYYNKVNNKIVAVPAKNLFRWMMLNLGQVSIKGIDINVDASLHFSNTILLKTGINYTYQKAVDKTIGKIYYNQQIPNTPYHNGAVFGSLIWKRWFFNYSFLYTGERYVLPENIIQNYTQPWYTTDVGIQKKALLKKQKILLGLEINNLFNQYYDVVLNFPMPGRNFRFSIAVNY